MNSSWKLPNPLGIIAGSGFYALDALSGADMTRGSPLTPYGEAACAPIAGSWNDHQVAFLTRHGEKHDTPPHLVNYRANLTALQQVGVRGLLLVNCVGGIPPTLGPGRICVPNQVIDYTWGRESTFFDQGEVRHTDLTEPFCAEFRAAILAAGASHDLHAGGVYGCAQGPRLETAAEVNRFARDGVDYVGMTAMPEVALARELEWPCAMLSLVVNYAAGRGEGVIDQTDVSRILAEGMPRVQKLIGELLQQA